MREFLFVSCVTRISVPAILSPVKKAYSYMDKNSGFDDGRQVVEELIREAQEGFQETQLAVNDVIHEFTRRR